MATNALSLDGDSVPDTVTSDDEMRDRGLSIDGEPHQDKAILEYLKETRILSNSEAAERIKDVFGYAISSRTIRKWVNKHDIRNPLNGPFADIHRDEKQSSTEPAQPESFWIDRSDDTPVHPFDTDLHQTKASEGGWWLDTMRSESSLTSQSVPHPQNETNVTDSENPDSDFGPCEGYLKPHRDVPPEAYRVERGNREVSLVAPPEAPESDGFPNLYCACACGECDERHYLDGDNGTIDCPNPVPVTIGGARRIYQTAEGSKVADDVDGHDVHRAIGKYAKVMKADRAILRREPTSGQSDGDSPTYTSGSLRYDDWTTVLLSLRVSPLDGENRLVTPYTLVDDCLDGWREGRDKLPDDFEYSVRYWLGTGTDEWASPHVHAIIWVADPDDEVRRRQFRPTVQTFVQSATFAPVSAHFDEHGQSHTLTDGVVRVEHDPLLVDIEELGEQRSQTESGAFDDILVLPENSLRDGTSVQSRVAVYVGSQHLGFALRGAERPADAEAAAFFEVGAQGRNRSYGSDEFYQFPDIHDALAD